MAYPKPTAYQDAAFAVIESTIERLFRESGIPVAHDEIAKAYQKDPVGHRILVERQNRLSIAHSLEWLAANDVAWFSARMSAGSLPSAGRYVRSRVDGKWAYAIR